VRFEDFDAYCQGLPAASLVVQWGGTHVYKVGEKIFALSGLGHGDGDEGTYVFKASEISFEMLTEAGLAVRAPYLPRGGWLALKSRDALEDDELRAYLAQSHALVAAGLSRRERRRLGLDK
jgi:predicted DNA-binding protein (MmcQ/YjbR family)